MKVCRLLGVLLLYSSFNIQDSNTHYT